MQPFCRNQQLGCAHPFCSWHPFYTTKWGAQPKSDFLSKFPRNVGTLSCVRSGICEQIWVDRSQAIMSHGFCMEMQLIHQRVDPVALKACISFCHVVAPNRLATGCQLFKQCWSDLLKTEDCKPFEGMSWQICSIYFCALSSVRFWRPCHFGVRPQPVVDENQTEHFFNH